MELPDLNYKELLLVCQKDKELAKKYFKKKFNKFFKNYNELEIEKPLSLIMGFYPLPDEFIIHNLNKEDSVERRKDYYFFTGTPGDRILFGNRRLPIVGEDPVPFMIPITKNKITKPILSNTFYFEIYILNKKFRKAWKNECLSLGFGTSNTYYKNQVGWTQKSWGFHSDDGHYINNNKSKIYSNIWKPDDIVGVGLTYVSKNNYKIFLTINGLLCNDEESFICEEILIPMFGFDYSNPIKINWGQEEFKFDLVNYINNSQILSVHNNFLLKNECIDNYKVDFKNIYNKGIFQIFAENKKNISNNEIYKSLIIDVNKNLIKEVNKNLIKDVNKNLINDISNCNHDISFYHPNLLTNINPDILENQQSQHISNQENQYTSNNTYLYNNSLLFPNTNINLPPLTNIYNIQPLTLPIYINPLSTTTTSNLFIPPITTTTINSTMPSSILFYNNLPTFTASINSSLNESIYESLNDSFINYDAENNDPSNNQN